MPGNRIILAYVLTHWLVTMDPAGRGVMRQRFAENVVLVAALNEGTQAICWCEGTGWTSLSGTCAYFGAHLARPGMRNWSEYVASETA